MGCDGSKSAGVSEGNTKSKAKLTLHYFPIFARGEIIRLVLAQGGIEYEDHRIQFQEWPEHKPNMPWGTLPVLEMDGKLMGQSNAIARSIARKAGLVGKTSFDAALADSVVDTLYDTQEALYMCFTIKDAGKRGESMKKVTSETIPERLGLLEKFLEANTGSPYFVGKSVTWADLKMFDLVVSFQAYLKTDELLKEFPKLAEHHQMVAELPRIKDYVANRPEPVPLPV